MESIGSLIKQELEKQERSISWLARKLSCDRTKVYRILQKRCLSIEAGNKEVRWMNSMHPTDFL